MKIDVCSHEDGIRRIHWFRLLLVSAVAPAATTLGCVGIGVILGSESMRWPWETGVYWAFVVISWGAFAGGLYGGAVKFDQIGR